MLRLDPKESWWKIQGSLNVFRISDPKLFKRLSDFEKAQTICERLGIYSFDYILTNDRLNLMESLTPIQPVLLGSVQTTLAVSEALYQQGLFVSAIRPPTVPEGSARLRITFSASHTEEQIDQLLSALGQMPDLRVD